MTNIKRSQIERRKERLERIERQLRSGELIIRKMTPEERKLYPPKNRSLEEGKTLIDGGVYR